ncbi:MAG: Hsp70 family protein, partial [Anaerolineae bacterium]
MEQAIGIDLGTYNSCAAYAVDEARVEILRSHYGPTVQGKVFPSFVRFDALGNPVAFGEQARREMATAPDLVVWGVKRLIGQPYSQAEGEVRRFAYPVEKEPLGNVVIRIGNREYTPGEVSSLLLRWIKDCAETLNPFIVGKVAQAVVTHPAYFDALQTEQTKEAAAQAGFRETELIAEPVAAALAYGLQLDASHPQYIAALDWGAGTLDIAIVVLRQGRDGLPILSEARPAKGNVALGGIDMDDALLAEAVRVYGLQDLEPLLPQCPAPGRGPGTRLPDLETAGLPQELRDLLLALLEAQAPSAAQATAAPEAWSDFCSLRDAVEQAKIHLSKVPATRLHTTYHGRPLEVKMARTSRDRLDEGKDWVLLEDTLHPLLATFRSHVESALRESGLRPEDLQHVLLIGGPMHMPCVQAVVVDVFRSNPQVVQELRLVREQGFPVDPMEAVARGAALYARRMGPKLGVGKINRDYGVLLETQGEILLRDGDGVPCEVAFPGVLSHGGNPGDVVSIGLYKVEKTPEGEAHYFRLGDYQFVPVFGPGGRSRFQPTLKAA